MIKKIFSGSVLMVNFMIFVSVFFAHAENINDKLADIKDPSFPLKAFATLQQAIEKEDYEAAWELVSSHVRIKFRNDFDKFKKNYSRKRFQQIMLTVEIKKTKFIRDKIAALVAIEPYKSVYMNNEKGVWKFSGRIHSYVSRATEDMQHLRRAVNRYSDKYGEYPPTIEKLIPNFIKKLPLDFFNPDKKPYVYKLSQDSWQIYSFGPDHDDDGGLVNYDIYNGIVSDGDIIYNSSSDKLPKAPWKDKKGQGKTPKFDFW